MPLVVQAVEWFEIDGADTAEAAFKGFDGSLKAHLERQEEAAKAARSADAGRALLK